MNEERRVLAKVFDIVTQRIASTSEDPNKSVVRYIDAETLQDTMDISITNGGATYDDLLKDIHDYLTYSVDTSHKQFLNQLYGGFNFPAFLGEVITALTNTSMYTYEVAPAGTLIELELIRKLNRLVGFENGDGTFLTGGSNANLVAMFSARNKVCPDIKTNGASSGNRLCAFVSEQSHYSFDTAANLLGIGTNQVRKIAVDANGCMRVDALETAIAQSVKKGCQPFFVAATAGTTLLGAFDPIPDIVTVAKKHDLWVHVDGAFGGPIILSPKHQHLLQGLDQTDSFAIDPHKLMNVPLICSVLLVRQKGRLLHNLTDLDTQYLYHPNDARCYDLGKPSVQCGKRVDGLKLWLAWRYFGDAGYAARTDKLISLAQYARQKVESDPRLELLAEPQSFAVCFRYQNQNGQDRNEFNLQLRERLRRSGRSLVNYGYWKDNLALRFVAANPDIETVDVDRFFEHLLNLATQMEEDANDGRAPRRQ